MAIVTRLQLQGLASVDPSNSAASGLQGAFLPQAGGYLRDVLYGNAFDTSSGTFIGGVGKNGKYVGNSSSCTASAPDTAGRYNTQSYSVLVLVDIVSLSGSFAGIYCKTAAATNGFALQQANGANSFWVYHDAGSQVYATTTFVPSLLTGTGYHSVLVTFDAAEKILRFYLDGKLIETSGVISTLPTLGSGRFVLFGERAQSNTYSALGSCYGLFPWNRKLTDQEALALTANPACLFKARQTPLYAVAATGVNGAIGWLEQSDTASVSSTVKVTGAASWTEASDTTAISASASVAASAAWTEPSDAMNVAASVGSSIAGNIGWTEQSDTASVSASVTVNAAAGWTEQPDTFAVAASLLVNTALGWTEAADTSIAAVYPQEFYFTIMRASVTNSLSTLSSTNYQTTIMRATAVSVSTSMRNMATYSTGTFL